MTPRDWFALALRVLGVMKIAEGFQALMVAFDIRVEAFHTQTGTVAGELHVAFGFFLMGLVLLLGAPALAGLLVPQRAPTPPPTP
jgi:hypothetical protein